MVGASREELVSVPVLGPEWQKSELHELSRRGKSAVRKEKRQRIWREWTRDQRGVCGVTWLTRKMLVIILSCMVVGTALVLFFTIPRPPSYSFYVSQPFTVNNSTVQFARTPANFSFTGNLNILADTTSSYLPLQYSDISVQLYHLTTNKQIATGNYGKNKVKKGNQEPVSIPVQFSYSAPNATDTTWNDIYSACGHMWTGTVRPPLRLRLVLTSNIVGLVTKPETSTQISDVTCPFELSSNSV
ncbi:uncharacterized protein MKK02DRAFT_23934 [Dioszegia hungarica]|uniref:Uncharacterized protein n=1 Tax=Dioszegia hungarica TaxID=4972 RepID=A0AA38HAL4_9TREE|nr:uncharacterized protein MKK02DRAFT_23934 [Dioszegia hungarica]KAI9637345.1 hypothetical protein MKK02DRAFT_23934 [Dioszegia hungarica]